MNNKNQQENSQPHPLDIEYDNLDVSSRETVSSSTQDLERQPSYGPLLHLSIRVLVVSLIVAFLASVAGNNAAPSSSAERIASAVNRFAVIVSLFCFVGILVAFQIPRVQSRVASRGLQPLRLASLNQLTRLVIVNAALIFLLWTVILLGLLTPGFSVVVLVLCTMTAPIMFLIILLEKNGPWRGYAVGFLTVFCAITFGNWNGMLLMLLGNRPQWNLGIGILASLPLLAGVACAVYAKLFYPNEEPESDEEPRNSNRELK